MQPSPQLLATLSDILGRPIQARHFQPVGGGSINEVFKIDSDDERPLIIKINSAAEFPQLFALEAVGLASLRPHMRVPDVIAQGATGDTSFLLLEWMATEAPSAKFWERFGEQLAAMHQVSGDYFGAAENNYMGSVPQDNSPSENWSHFFATRRLLPLAKKCVDKGLLSAKEMAQFESLCPKLDRHFTETTPRLLHGDLWSGNYLCGAGAQPVLIDPAVYYGHPSVDLAMTTLFGGFDARFYEAYHYHAPLPENYKEQWALCNLYPLLIHLLLFGRSYLSGIQSTLKRFTA